LALHPQLSYSTHLNLPNIHSITILTVTKNKKITIFTINPLTHITSGVTDMIINSKSKIKKIIQKIKKRNDTGNTLTLKESKPHSNLSALINFDLTKNLPTPIIIGVVSLIISSKFISSEGFECGFDSFNVRVFPVSLRFFIFCIIFLILDLELIIISITPIVI